MRRIILALVLVAACGTDPTAPTNPTQPLTASYGQVEEIKLSNGTLCAVVRSGTGVGIDCEWKEG